MKKDFSVYYIYYQNIYLEPIYVSDWFVGHSGLGYVNGISRYKDFAYIFTTYEQAKDILLKIQKGNYEEKYLIGEIIL